MDVRVLYCRLTYIASFKAGLRRRHCRQMPRAYDVEGPTKDGCKILRTYVSKSINNVLCIVSTKLSIFASRHQLLKSLKKRTI